MSALITTFTRTGCCFLSAAPSTPRCRLTLASRLPPQPRAPRSAVGRRTLQDHQGSPAAPPQPRGLCANRAAQALLINPRPSVFPPAEFDSTKGKVKRIQSHLSEGCCRAQLPRGTAAKGGRERCGTGGEGSLGGRSHLRLLVSAEEPDKSTSGGGRGSLNTSTSRSRGCPKPSAGGWLRLAHQRLCRARCIQRLLCQEARAGP